MKTKLTFLFGFFVLTILLVPFCIKAAAGLTISPPISDFTLEPGQTVTRIIRINNPTPDLIEVYPRVMNFKAGGDTGEPSFYDVGDSSERFAIAKWISFSQTKLALAPEQIVEFEYTIAVPTDAEPGGHYGAVFFANEPEATVTDTSKVTMGSMIGSLLLIRTPGQVVEKGLLDLFTTDKSVYVDNKIAFSTRISNVGNVHIKPLGKIVIKDMFGRDVDTITFNEQGGNVLPDSSRKYPTTWQSSKLLLGRYKADLSLTYGQGAAQDLTGDAYFWVIPLWFIVVVSVIILTLIIFLFRRLFFTRKRPRKQGPRPPMSPQRPVQAQPGRPEDSEPKGPVILR